MTEGPWPTADDPDDDTDWAVYLDDEALHPVRDDADSPLVVFVHIQKTAGKTLRHILRRQYAGPDRSVLVPNFFAKPDLHWSTVRELVKRRPPGLQVAHGHMLFVPERWPRDTRFITFLREPVERTISHYYWLNERRPDRSALRSIEESIELGEIRDNLQVRVLAGANPSGPVTSTMADDAMAALDRFAAVGLTSRFDESLVHFARTFGWRTTAYERVNSTSSRVPRDALTPATVKRIEEHNRYDQELYAVAAERFDELMLTQPDDFHVEVDIVRAAVAWTALDGPSPERPIVLSTEGLDAHAMLVSSGACQLVAEHTHQRLRAATQQIALLKSQLRAAKVRSGNLENAWRDARQKVARARERSRDTPPEAEATAPDASVETLVADRRKPPRDPNRERKPKEPRSARPKETPPT